MADEDAKQSQGAASSSSSSSSQRLDQSLVQVFGELEQTLRDLTSSVQANTVVSQETRALQQKLHARGKLDDRQRAAILTTLLTLVKSVNDAVKLGQLNTATSKAMQKQLADAHEELSKADDEIKERLKEVSGEHAVYDPEGLPPLLQRWWISLGNVGWKNKAKVAGYLTAGGFAPTVWVKIKIVVVYVVHLLGG